MLLIDDGNDRPGCVDGGGNGNYNGTAVENTAGCYSRAIAYELNEKLGTAKVTWQFAYPVLPAAATSAAAVTSALSARAALASAAAATPAAAAASPRAGDASLEDVFLHDAYNFDGGSVARLSNGNFLVGLTAIAESQRDWNPDGAVLLFEVGGETGAALAVMELPRPVQTGGAADGGYRAIPWSSIAGESTSRPF